MTQILIVVVLVMVLIALYAFMIVVVIPKVNYVIRKIMRGELFLSIFEMFFTVMILAYVTIGFFFLLFYIFINKFI